MEQFIYVTQLHNIHTNEHFVKVGYTKNVLQRLGQLEQHNKHFQYTDTQLYKHEWKSKGYWYDEQELHEAFKRDRAHFDKDTMPDGRTECYSSLYEARLVQKLHRLGYKCEYDTRSST